MMDEELNIIDTQIEAIRWLIKDGDIFAAYDAANIATTVIDEDDLPQWVFVLTGGNLEHPVELLETVREFMEAEECKPQP